MQNPKTDVRRTTHRGATGPQAMSIQQYVELVDRLFENQQFTPDVKKPPQPQR